MKRIYSIYCIQGLVQFRITEESSLFVRDQCLLVFEGHLYPWICNLTNLLQRNEFSQKLAIYMYWCPNKPVKFWFKYLQLKWLQWSFHSEYCKGHPNSTWKPCLSFSPNEHPPPEIWVRLCWMPSHSMNGLVGRLSRSRKFLTVLWRKSGPASHLLLSTLR